MSLTIQGEGQTLAESAQARRDFLARLKLCTKLDLKIDAKGQVTEGPKTAGKAPPDGASKPIVDAVREMIRLGGKLVIRVRKKPRPDDPIIDRYCQRRIILDHIDAFDETPPKDAPSATTRCEVVAHVMAEYAAALLAGQTECEEGFDDNHQAGIKAQKAHREGIKQTAPPHQNTLVKNGKKAVVFEHCDGSTTIAEQDETGAIKVRHTPAKEKAPKKKLEKALKSLKSVEQLFTDHPFVLTGTVEDVGDPPADWTNFGTAHQAVYYSNVEWLKGEARPNSVLVHHLCFAGTLTAQPRKPGLNRKLFAPGRRLMVFAFLAPDPNYKGGVRLEANEPNAFVEAEPRRTAKRKQLRKRRKQKGSS